MGLPEYVAGARSNSDSSSGIRFRSATASRRPRALILSDAVGDLSYADDSRLGFQFLLGVFPFTRLYYQRGADSLLQELLIDQLKEAGFDVYLCPKINAAQASAQLAPRLVLDSRFQQVSINAYDAFFFRIVSIQANALLRSFSFSVDGEVEPSVAVPFEVSTTRYKSSAHAPELAGIFETETNEVLRRSLKGILDKRFSRRVAQFTPPSEHKTTVLIAYPEVSTWVGTTLGREVVASYGFPALPAYANPALSRILQRGIAQGLAREEIPYVIAAQATPSNRPLKGVWEIQTSLIDVKIEDRLTLRAKVLLRDNRVSPPLRIEKKVCELRDQEYPAVDGYLVEALEQSIQQLVTESLGFPNTLGTEGESRLACSS